MENKEWLEEKLAEYKKDLKVFMFAMQTVCNDVMHNRDWIMYISKKIVDTQDLINYCTNRLENSNGTQQ